MYRFLFLSLLVSGFFSCGEDLQPLFDLEYQLDFTIDPGLNTIDTHVYTIRDVPSRLAEFAAANSILPDSIISANPNRATITNSFQNIDFNFVDKLSIWIVSTSDPTDMSEMFFLDFVDLGEDSELRLLSSISNVIPYLKEGIFDVEVRLQLRSFSPAEINSRLNFSITAFD